MQNMLLQWLEYLELQFMLYQKIWQKWSIKWLWLFMPVSCWSTCVENHEELEFQHTFSLNRCLYILLFREGNKIFIKFINIHTLILRVDLKIWLPFHQLYFCEFSCISFVVWWFDVTNKIMLYIYIYI